MANESEPVSYWGQPHAASARLQKALDAPKLFVTTGGGGIPEIQTLELDRLIILDRREVEHIVGLLGRMAAAEDDYLRVCQETGADPGPHLVPIHADPKAG
jgi:hypothetical protein